MFAKRTLYIIRWMIAALALPMVVYGEVAHGFSVASDKQVLFSPGNLQFNAANGTHQSANGSTQQGTRRFAEHQWDFVGDDKVGNVYENGVKCDNSQISATYNGWIDLFGWSTSGWNSGAEAYQPWATSETNSDYYPGGSMENSLTGSYAYADWGVYNEIGNDAPGSWRTLTKDEWAYLFHGRLNYANLFGLGTVNGITGTIILPDDWVLPSGMTFSPSTSKDLSWDSSYDYYYNSNGNNYSHNTYTKEQWENMESAGAVFLPATGNRGGSNVRRTDSGYYWSSTQFDTDYAYRLYFSSEYLSPQYGNSRCYGRSIRLVKEVEPEPPTPPEEDLCMDGILLFREDFGGNDPNDSRVSTTPVAGMTYKQATTDQFSSLTMYSGRYLVTKSGYCNGDTTGWTLPGADQSGLRSQWYIQDDHTYPNDYSLGYFMEIDGKGGNQQFYQTEINGLCEGSKLTFSAYVANVFTWFQYNWYTLNRDPVVAPCLKFVLTNPQTGEVLAEHSTQKIPFDANLPGLTDWQYSSAWHLVGMNFTVPVGVHTIRLSIYNNVSNGLGNDFALDDIEIRLCLPQVTISGESEVCENSTTTLTADFTNDGTLAEPLEYKWWHSTDSLTWTELSNTSASLTLATTQKADSGWYKIAVSGAGNIGSVNCRTLSEPFLLNVQTCAPPPCPEMHYATRDTTVCNTLMPFTWHGLLFNEPGSQTTTLQDERGCDTLQTTWTLDTIHCERPCPEIQSISIDTMVCDSLLPFTWRGILFVSPTTQYILQQSPRGCDSIEYAFTLDTMHCERLYDIIVNKYNWQLLCNNVRVRELFPTQTVSAYQWYKDGIAIPNATEDNYSEQNELQGAFQLRLLMNNDRYVWSEILTIQPAQTLTPNRIRVYNHNGTLIYQSETETTLPYLPKGLYIIQIEQNGEQRIEKKLIP